MLDLKKKEGFSLIEVGISLILLTILFISISNLNSESRLNEKAEATVDKLKKVHRAALAYITKYQEKIENLEKPTAINIVEKSSQNNLPSLKKAGFLSSSFKNTNPYGQEHVLLVRKTASEAIDALIITKGGKAIPPAILPKIAIMIGASGGFISDAHPYSSEIIQGAFGGWNSDISNWQIENNTPEAGRLASTLTFEKGAITSGYLYRHKIANSPEANMMNTNLDLNNHDINNVNRLLSKNILSKDINVNKTAFIEKNLLGNKVNSQMNINVIGEAKSFSSHSSKFYDYDDSSFSFDPSNLSSANNIDVARNLSAKRIDANNISAQNIHSKNIIARNLVNVAGIFSLEGRCVKPRKMTRCFAIYNKQARTGPAYRTPNGNYLKSHTHHINYHTHDHYMTNKGYCQRSGRNETWQSGWYLEDC